MGHQGKSPLFTGDDLTKLDAYGLSLLTNREVIAIDQAGVPARPVSTATSQQVWSAKLRDGSYVVALYNLGPGPASVTADFGDLGISGPVQVRDVWQHSTMRVTSGSMTRDLPGAWLGAVPRPSRSVTGETSPARRESLLAAGPPAAVTMFTTLLTHGTMTRGELGVRTGFTRR